MKVLKKPDETQDDSFQDEEIETTKSMTKEGGNEGLSKEGAPDASGKKSFMNDLRQNAFEHKVRKIPNISDVLTPLFSYLNSLIERHQE